MIPFTQKEKFDYDDLLRIITLLRSPEGCPWDRVQTHTSIRRGMLEEAYEACEAIDTDNPVSMQEELGDVLMQVVFHADIEKDAGRFTMDDVCDGVVKKLLYRHPHVFGNETGVAAAEEVPVTWEALKRAEKGQASTADAMDSVARSLPGTWRAEKIQSKAAKDGFDFADLRGAMDKLHEEVGELDTAICENSNIAEELGDVLFAAVKVCRFANIDPETAIHATCDKFIRRYRQMEHKISAKNTTISELSLDELVDLWDNSEDSWGESCFRGRD